uniref:MD-2-related lipid-recognition domain-containing protein n=1 Tax=Stomoxys calcitrans TaxID=35570 RepID=A0A1I8PZ33_STOCA
MWKHHLFVVLAIAWATQSMAAKRNFDFLLYNNTCTKYDDVFKRFDCAHKMVSKGRYLFDCFFMFERPLHKEAILQMILHYTPLKGIKPVKFLDVKINVCDILGQSGSHVPLMKALFKEFRKNSDLPYACPVRGDNLYSMVNYSLDASTLPPYTPIMVFNYTLLLFEHNKKIGSVHTSGATVPRT